MGEGKIIRRGGGAKTAAPSITVVSTSPTGVTFTLTNNDDNTAIVSYGISTTRGAVELAASATSSNITVDLAAGTYTLTAYATVVGEVATSATASVEIVVPLYELLYDSETANNGNPISFPTTQIDITGLNIGKDDTLRLVYTLVGDSTNTTNILLRVNDITSNYATQFLDGIGTSIGAERFTTEFFTFTRSTDRVQGVADIKVSNNDRFVVQNSYMFALGTQAASLLQRNINLVNTTTVSSITKLSIIGTSNQIATGTKIALYKVTEAA